MSVLFFRAWRTCRSGLHLNLLLLSAALACVPPAKAGGGTVVAWGMNNYGQTSVPPELTNAVQVAAGSDFSVALRNDGTVVAWGDNSLGQTNVPLGLSNVTAVAAGNWHALALKSNGTVISWGANISAVAVPAGLTNIVSIAAGSDLSFGFRSDGTVAAWGYTNGLPEGLTNIIAVSGRNGHYAALRRDGTAVGWGTYYWDGVTNPPTTLTNAISITSGGNHALAIRNDGTVFGWGNNDSHQTFPPPNATNITAIAAGLGFSLALRSDGTVLRWGDASGGSPLPVPALTNVFDIAAGQDHCVAIIGNGIPIVAHLLSAREVVAGSTAYVRLVAGGDRPLTYFWQHNGTNLGQSASPELILTNIQPNQAGGYSVTVQNTVGAAASAVTEITIIPARVVRQPDHQTAMFSTTARFELDMLSYAPLRYQWYHGEKAIDGATNRALEIKAVTFEHSGAYWATASNEYGLVASDTASLEVISVVSWGSITNTPTGLTNLVMVKAEENINIGLAANGTARDWNRYENGPSELTSGLTGVVSIEPGSSRVIAVHDNGSVSATSIPPQSLLTFPLDDVLQVSAGGGHRIALKADGTISSWGYNGYGQTNIPVGLMNVVAVAAGGDHSLALRSDGQVFAWGRNYEKQSSVPPNLSDVVAVAAGQRHSVALRANGSVVAWGDNYYLQTNVPPGLSNVISISAENDHTLALRTDGTVVGWGKSTSGQTLIPSGLTNVVSIGAGWTHSVALIGNTHPFISPRLPDRAVIAGDRVMFQPFVSGLRPTRLQWLRNGVALPDATNAWLGLTNVQIDQSGLYSLVASNKLGMVTGAVCELLVCPEVLIQTFDSITIPSFGEATPYPVVLNVAGVTGRLFRASVELRGVSHTNPDDLDVLLVAPDGRAVMLMSDAGGTADLLNANLRFDDATTAVIPDSGPASSGIYRPSNYSPSDSLPQPAPTTYGAYLSSLRGMAPNGTWQLFIYDDASNNSGSIQGVTLRITSIESTVPPALESIEADGSALRIKFLAAPQRAVEIQMNNSLSTAGWVTVERALGSGGLQSIPIPIPHDGQRYFRLRTRNW